MPLEHQHVWKILLIVAAISCLPLKVALAVDPQKKQVIAVVTMPQGIGKEALIAREMIPSAIDGFVELVPLKRLLQDAKNRETVGGSIVGSSAILKEQARQASLAFDLIKAAELWRQAADELLHSAALASEPYLVASYVLEAASASVEAGQPDLALLYFRKALAVDTDLTLDAAFSPLAKEVFDRARRLGPAEIGIPEQEVLHQIITPLSASGILWVAVGRDNGRHLITEKIVLREDGSHEPETRLSLPLSQEAHDRWLKAESIRLKNQLVLRLGVKIQIQKPWYTKWWTWATVGGVVAAGIVAGLVISASRSEPSADVVVYH